MTAKKTIKKKSSAKKAPVKRKKASVKKSAAPKRKKTLTVPGIPTLGSTNQHLVNKTLKAEAEKKARQALLKKLTFQELNDAVIGSPTDFYYVLSELRQRSKVPLKMKLGQRWYPVSLSDYYIRNLMTGSVVSMTIVLSLYDVRWERYPNIHEADFQDALGTSVNRKFYEVLAESGLAVTSPKDLEENIELVKKTAPYRNKVGTSLEVTSSVLEQGRWFFGPRLVEMPFGTEKYPRIGLVEPELELTDTADVYGEDDNNEMALPFLRLFSLDYKRYVYVDVRDTQPHHYIENAVEKLVLPPELKEVITDVFQAKDVFGDLFAGRHGGMVVLANGAPGIGKCLGKGTPVLLVTGKTVMVEQIVAGDRLMGPDGKARNVLTTSNGNGELYRIDPVKGESWICNDVHMMSLVNSYTGDIVDIALDKYLASTKTFKHDHKLFSVGIDSFENAGKQLLVDPYFLGVWFGDGSKHLRDLNGELKLMNVGISNTDSEIVDMCEEIATKWQLKISVNNSKPCPTYYFVNETKRNTNALVASLRLLVGNEINIPSEYLTASRNDRLQFLAGFIDADGDLTTSNCFTVTQKREDWARAVWFVARSLGLCATIKLKKGGYRRADGTAFVGDYYRVTISGDVDQIPTRIQRKHAAPRKQIKVATRTGFTATNIGAGDYYGFTLDGDGRFLLGDFTVTHNTLTAEVFAEQTKRPLYVLEMGELGVQLDKVEESLQLIFARAARWSTVLLFDEVDIFLSKRTEADLERNAIVGVFLRLLDQYKGMLFLTTNRADAIDPAFSSRITLRLDYPNLDEVARERIWNSMLISAGLTLSLGEGSLKEIAAYKLNGRQIRNVVRLLKATAKGGNYITFADVKKYIKYSPAIE